jgi:hypothetical protein
MTEEQANVNAEALAISMGITFYVVRNPEGDFLAVQRPSDDHEIVATIEPPPEPEHKLEYGSGDWRPANGTRSDHGGWAGVSCPRATRWCCCWSTDCS